MLALVDCPQRIRGFIEGAKHGESCEVIVGGKGIQDRIGSLVCKENVTGRNTKLLFTCKPEEGDAVRIRIEVVPDACGDEGGDDKGVIFARL